MRRRWSEFSFFVVCVFVCTWTLEQTKKDKDLKFGTNTNLHHIYFFSEGASFEKLPCYEDFVHIFSITVFSIYEYLVFSVEKLYLHEVLGNKKLVGVEW